MNFLTWLSHLDSPVHIACLLLHTPFPGKNQNLQWIKRDILHPINTLINISTETKSKNTTSVCSTHTGDTPKTHKHSDRQVCLLTIKLMQAKPKFNDSTSSVTFFSDHREDRIPEPIAEEKVNSTRLQHFSCLFICTNDRPPDGENCRTVSPDSKQDHSSSAGLQKSSIRSPCLHQRMKTSDCRINRGIQRLLHAGHFFQYFAMFLTKTIKHWSSESFSGVESIERTLSQMYIMTLFCVRMHNVIRTILEDNFLKQYISVSDDTNISAVL